MNQPDNPAHAINGSTQLLALFGKDLSYSRSPELQNSWIRSQAINACYLPMEWNTPEDFLSGVEALSKSKSFLGANITNPFKSVVTTSSFFESDERVVAVGAANTLFRKGTKWLLTNTDIDGICVTLMESRENFAQADWDVVILGAGGAAAAAAFTFTKTFHNCRVSNVLRNPSRAHAFLVSSGINLIAFPETPPIESGESEEPLLKKLNESHSGRGRILVNTTPLGQKREANPMANMLIRKWLAPQAESSFYFDMAYGENPALQLAQDLKIPHSNGMIMLTAQAERSFAIWKDSLMQDQ